MDLRQLTYFVRVIELRSFTKAAEVLRISQPAIGEQIKNLEAELNTSLLTRHSRGVEPTEVGRILFNKAQAILYQVADARSAVREYEAGLRGNVTLGLTPGLSEAIAAALIETCAQEFPGISINIVEDLSSSLVNRLEIGSEPLSFAIVSGYTLSVTKNLEAQRLFDQALYAVAGAKLIGKTADPITFDELAQFRLILLGNGGPVRHGLKAQLQQIAREHDLTLSIAYELQAASVVKQLIEREIGVTLLPFDAVRTHVEDGRLSARRVVSPEVRRELHLIWNKQRPLTASEEAIKGTLSRLVKAKHEPDTEA